MKTIVLTLALATSACIAAEIDFSPEPDWEENLKEAKDTVKDVLEHTERIKNDVVKKAMSAVKSSISLAQLGDADHMVEFHAANDDAGPWAVALGRDGTPPLLIGSSAMEQETTSQMQEDLAVMSRILAKSAGRDDKESAMGIVINTLPGSRRPQTLYLQDYGALFMLNVKFPLVPTAPKSEEKPEKPVDTTWEQTKRELYGAGGGGGGFQRDVRLFMTPKGEPAVEYDADEVEELKSELIESLKNASNIRHLKPQEFITVAVVGNSSSGARTTKKINTRGGNIKRAEVFAFAAGGQAPSRESVMTLRVKKSDVDAYANSSIDLAEFTKRVAISAY